MTEYKIFFILAAFCILQDQVFNAETSEESDSDESDESVSKLEVSDELIRNKFQHDVTEFVNNITLSDLELYFSNKTLSEERLKKCFEKLNKRYEALINKITNRLGHAVNEFLTKLDLTNEKHKSSKKKVETALENMIEKLKIYQFNMNISTENGYREYAMKNLKSDIKEIQDNDINLYGAISPLSWEFGPAARAVRKYINICNDAQTKTGKIIEGFLTCCNKKTKKI